MIPILIVFATAALMFVALVETAFGLLMRLPQRLEAERESESDALSAYLVDPVRFFVPARLLRGILVTVIVVLLAQVTGTGFPAGVVLLGGSLALVIGVGHLVPSLIVRRSPDRFLELLLPAFTVAASLLGPVTALVLAWLGPANGRRHAADSGGDSGSGAAAPETEPASADAEDRLLRSVVGFSETLVREVMTPRPDIVALPATATIEDLRRLVREQEYSRVPVFSENLDNIVGLVVVKDLIQMAGEPDASRRVDEMMRPAAFVPETKRVVDLLREFQQKRFHLAMVVDEYGGTAGLVTVEDLVEELVGEIRDEYDSEADPVVRESDDTFVFSAKVGIGELTERLGLEVEEGAFETVGGFVLAQVGRVPSAGERFELGGFVVEILEAERRRIHKVRIRRLDAPVVEADAS
jgi:putative hemolysin